jgi:hypothetical protein
MEMMDMEVEQSKNYYIHYLNNVRALIKIYESLLYKENFIKLPGDEIVEKKHLNIKNLTAKMNNTDLSKKSTRRWPGLGQNNFDVDYTKLEAFADFNGKFLILIYS